MSGSMKDFGQYIREARERAKISQLCLAVELGYSSESMVSKIETGRKGLPPKLIKKLAQALKLEESEVRNKMLEIERSRMEEAAQ